MARGSERHGEAEQRGSACDPEGGVRAGLSQGTVDSRDGQGGKGRPHPLHAQFSFGEHAVGLLYVGPTEEVSSREVESGEQALDLGAQHLSD